MAQNDQLSLAPMSRQYAYQSLPDDYSIRVLILNPGEEGDSLSGTIETTRLNGRREASATPQAVWLAERPYEAISYVWGSNIMDHVIILDGRLHLITANLSDALHQCRLSDELRTLWADSICINQEDLEEKGRQVAMMGRIYSCSQRTLICLGTDPEKRDHAQEAFSVLLDTNDMIERTFQNPIFSWKLDSFPWPCSDDPLVNDSRWESVQIMTGLEWFKRGWVVQEVALARDALILWSGLAITWLVLSRANTWYEERVFHLADKPDLVIWGLPFLLELPYRQQRSSEAGTFLTARNENNSILMVLSAARFLSVGDPRDRIYAFMTLPLVRKPVPTLQPNYEQEPMEVYHQFAVEYLRLTGDLTILSCVEHGEKSLENARWSSWVPRWDNGRKRMCRSELDGLWGFGTRPTSLRTFTIIDEKSGTSPRLQVRAVIFDTIRFASMPFDRDWAVEDVIAVWEQMKDLVWFPSVHDDLKTLDHCLQFLNALNDGLWFGPSWEHWLALLKAYARILDNADKQQSGIANSLHIPAGVQFWHTELLRECANCKVFLLGRGYFGLGPQVVENGDICALVFGVMRPLILRRVSGAQAHHYKVVGPAYLVSHALDETGFPFGFHYLDNWDDWDKLCESQGWESLGFKVEDIILE